MIRSDRGTESVRGTATVRGKEIGTKTRTEIETGETKTEAARGRRAETGIGTRTGISIFTWRIRLAGCARLRE